MKKNLVILGSGPRALAVALRACQKKEEYRIYLVDSNPLNTWKFPSMLPDLQMRSPITFDLVTFQEDLQNFSLSSFLGYGNKFISKQRDIEGNEIYCDRKEFITYLNSIINILKIEGCVFVKHNCIGINQNNVTLSNLQTLYYDYLVVALGSTGSTLNYPNYLKGNMNIKYVSNLVEKDWFNQPVNVVGSGQQSAEIAHYLLTQKAKVTWLRNKKLKVEQYPVPSYTNWGVTTALGDYYLRAFNKDQYLKKVKEWGPSITPYIFNKLRKYKFKSFIPTSTKEIDITADFILATGVQQDVKNLPFNFDIALNKDPRYPELKYGFRSISHSNISFTGLLALKHDGPRQGSIISSGVTAKTIINCLDAY